MNLSTPDRKKVLVFGFYQSPGSIRPVLTDLRRRRLLDVSVIGLTQDGETTRIGRVASRRLGLILGVIFGLLADVATWYFLARKGDQQVALPLVLVCAGLAALGWITGRLLDALSDMRVSSRYQGWVLPGESLVIVSTSPLDAPYAAEILAEAGNERPPVFLLHPRLSCQPEAPITRINSIPGEDAINMRASKLAKGLANASRGNNRSQLLAPRLKICERSLKEIYERLAGAVQIEQGIALSAEWLLDNTYIVQSHVDDYRRNLTPNFYRDLPFLTSGPHAGLPRVYAIANELVADWDAHLTRQSIQSFLQAFQSEVTLTTGELWALPMMLRLRLIEYLTSLSVEVDRRKSESDQAAFWANRLLYTARREPGRIPEMLASIVAECSQPSAHLVEEFLSHLYDEEAAITPVRAWLQSKFPSPIEDVVRQDVQQETSDQVSMSNILSTLRLLSQIDWREIFEAVSHVEAMLWTDPALIYGQMDFVTRDRYRHVVERLSRRGNTTEEAVARMAVDLSRAATEDPRRHVGYYLIDDGLRELQRAVSVRPSLRYFARVRTTRHAALVYVGAISVVTVGLVFGAVRLFPVANVSKGALGWLAVLFVLPASELALQLVNYVVTRSFAPRPLPKMAFENGIPDEFRTLVVVPMMLLTPESIRDEVERLEIRALANPDQGLLFGLLADYSDAPNQRMPEDLELLEVAIRGIERLNREHDPARFVLLYRERQWSDSEQCWMGWERKRGKIEDLNRFLVGDSSASERIILGAGVLDVSVPIKFVITLDSDTQLLRDTAARLVATLAHPLNRPALSPDRRSLVRGFAIVQPRVSTSLPSATASLFTRLFSDSAGIDPYTHAVSDVYQDIAGSGTYHGKGIYDVQAFHTILESRFPESHVLSHDLIEGSHSGVGLASDIELLDVFPPNYGAYCARQQRWIRGDWQILDWLFPRVPTGSGKRARNPLSGLEKWKVFDNLRRSLVPIGVVALLLVGSAISSNPGLCASLVFGLTLAPLLFPLLERLTRAWLLDPMMFREPGLNLARSMLFLAVTPHQAELNLSAILQVAYRRLVSHRNLLRWTTSTQAARRKQNYTQRLMLQMAWVPVFSIAAVVIVGFLRPAAFWPVLPFAILWASSALLIAWLDRPITQRTANDLGTADREMLRNLARLTWRYFDDFVKPETHSLPPDNYQNLPRAEVAERTSPTNIGLYLLSVVAAHDLGYLSPEEVIDRLLATMTTISKLELYRGHLYNWYDTRDLKPLGDRYVSMVDSGNLLGCLWALGVGIDQVLDAPVIGRATFQGLADTVFQFETARHLDKALAAPELSSIRKLLNGRPESPAGMIRRLRNLKEPAEELIAVVKNSRTAPQESEYWAGKFLAQVNACIQVIDRYLPWVDVLETPAEEGLLALGPKAHGLRRLALQQIPSLRALANGTVPGLSELLLLHVTAPSKPVSDDLMAWVSHLTDEGLQSQIRAFGMVERATATLEHVRELDDGMEMTFLYDHERRLFAIGYNTSDQRLDRSYYDLLASEARLGSFLAIARGDVPTEHWWALGRPHGSAYLKRPLLSWNGTMFEYLMPLLLTRSYANSLLDRACETALEVQMIYAKKRGIPWGISEAAFSALDSRQIYQYRAFGIPGLALKRGLEEDFVVSPYSSALALAVDAKAAAANLRPMGPLARLGLMGEYGFYESIDFTQQHGPKGDRGLVVTTFMAHHQGMSLIAIDNALNEDPMQHRFHADPRVKSTVSLLYERIPVAPPYVRSSERETPFARLAPIVAIPAPGRVETPNTPTPRTCLLSNGAYKLMVTNAGGNYSRWKDFDVTRWRSDPTADDRGTFFYLKDLDSGFVWSTTHQPTGIMTQPYHAVFSAEKAEFRRRDRGIETVTEVVVSPEDNAEVWRITLINQSAKTRHLEVTSFAELALASHGADRTHPAFSKMFIQTAALRDDNALLAWRRSRSPEEAPIWAAHIAVTQSKSDEPLQFETDRASFVGRGRTARNPEALDRDLSASTGFVLDPIFSLRMRIALEPSERIQLAFVTAAAETHDDVQAIALKYGDMETVSRAFHLAWTQAQLELRHLRITPGEAQLYQQLAGHIIYPHSHLRAPSDKLSRNTYGQSRLWAYGISGDLPIVLVTIDEAQHLDLVQEALTAHNFWHSRGLICDLVILNEEAASYEQPLEKEIERLVAARTQLTGVDQPGGVFLRPIGKVAPDDMTLLLSAARIVLVAARGSLSQQIGAPSGSHLPQIQKRDRKPVREEPSAPLPFIELTHFNGIGGFTEDGREYATYLDKGVSTPRPWANIMANSKFGAMVTDEGPGFTWFGNSQSNRLTAWSNDPISNPASEAIYIYDRDLDVLWTPTALPIRENDPYRTRHGQGYSVFEHNSHAIDQELTVFVPTEDSGGATVRIQKLRLINRSSRRRSLAVTFYLEWLLGANREDSQLNVATNWDLQSQAIFARNPFNTDFGSLVAFAACSQVPTSFTGDRAEILGRNGSMGNPASLRNIGLSGRMGGGLDPCAALQCTVEIEPGDQIELIFLLGEASDPSTAREMVKRFREPYEADKALTEVKSFWDKTLETIQVETPDHSIDLLFNRWILYQVLSCRVWGRSAFYQSGGAFGYRDQLQDITSLIYAKPEIARDQILLNASRQFLEGDVQHWWHPQTGAGVRTRISDDLLWLPFVTAFYVGVTGDKAILEENVAFIQGRQLAENEHDAYFVPEVSQEQQTLLEHCRRAIEKGATAGPHGLPLIGGGDWNDGLNLVGAGGKGESIWLGWFLIKVFRDMAQWMGDPEVAENYKKRAADLAKAIESSSWDGEWYLRAFFDDGTPLGSQQNEEAKIDSLAQSWAVICGAAQPDRSRSAMEAADSQLAKEHMVLLFTPPFDRSAMQPGYIKGYPPGVRENGGQYTHGSLWMPMAWARLGEGDKAVRLLQKMNPIQNSSTPDDIARYLVEPYAVAADVYSLEGRVGMGGWTWYTGSASWTYRVWLEEVFGFHLHGETLTMDPVIPTDWPSFKLRYRFRDTTYFIEVHNPNHVSRGVRKVVLDGKVLEHESFPLVDDHNEHRIEVWMGSAGDSVPSPLPSGASAPQGQPA